MAIIRLAKTLWNGRYLSNLLRYKLSFNHLLIKLLEKHNLPNFTKLYSYACSSGEQNVAFLYIILHLTYIRGLIEKLADAVPNEQQSVSRVGIYGNHHSNSLKQRLVSVTSIIAAVCINKGLYLWQP